MTEPGQSHQPAEKPVGHRHRRSIVDGLRAGGSGAGAWFALLRTRRFTRREWLIGAAAFALIALLGLGYVAVNSTDEDAGLPPQAEEAGSGDPAASASVTSPPGSVTPPADSGTPSPSPTGSGGNNGGGGDNGRPPESGDGRPEPRQVGPVGFDAFETFLTAFCRAEGQRAAVLLDGPDGPGDKSKTGNWACVKVVTFTKINLDAACRDSFGGASQARQTTRGDARTWRCFDR